MRIGLFGNTNNNPLLLAVALRQLGHDAVLVVNSRDRLHRPESMFSKLEQGYPRWIMDCSDIPEEDFIVGHPRIDPVLNFLAHGSTGLVLNDLGPSLLEFCSLPSVALLTGSDLTYYANPQTTARRMQSSSPEYLRSPGGRLSARKWDEFIARQRAGIRDATVVSTAIHGLVPEMDALLRDIGIDEANRDSYYMTGVPLTAPRPLPGGRLRLINGARLNWKPLAEHYSTLDRKGTDTLLEGFAAFVAGGGDAELVLVRKGHHVAETEALVDRLGLRPHVLWRDEMSLREFHAEVLRSHVVCDQLGDTFTGMVTLDAMALGRTVIANFRPDVSHPLFPKPVAGCQARTPAEVADHLKRLASSAEERARAGREAFEFAQRHFSPQASARRCAEDLRRGRRAAA